MAHTQSQKWQSQDHKERAQFKRVNNLIHHLAPESPYAPKTYSEWVEHRASMNEEQREALLKNIEVMQARKSITARVPIEPTFANDNKLLHDNRSTVLSLASIWANNYTPTLDRPDAPWPDQTEMQHEGADRKGGDGGKQDYGRRLPLPRYPTNETSNWKIRPMVEPQNASIDVLQSHPDDILNAQAENATMDMDLEFWEEGLHYLGMDLMREL